MKLSYNVVLIHLLQNVIGQNMELRVMYDYEKYPCRPPKINFEMTITDSNTMKMGSSGYGVLYLSGMHTLITYNGNISTSYTWIKIKNMNVEREFFKKLERHIRTIYSNDFKAGSLQIVVQCLAENPFRCISNYFRNDKHVLKCSYLNNVLYDINERSDVENNKFMSYCEWNGLHYLGHFNSLLTSKWTRICKAVLEIDGPRANQFVYFNFANHNTLRCFVMRYTPFQCVMIILPYKGYTGLASSIQKNNITRMEYKIQLSSQNLFGITCQVSCLSGWVFKIYYTKKTIPRTVVTTTQTHRSYTQIGPTYDVMKTDSNNVTVIITVCMLIIVMILGMVLIYKYKLYVRVRTWFVDTRQRSTYNVPSVRYLNTRCT